MMDNFKARAVPAPWWGGIEVLLYNPRESRRYGQIVTGFIVDEDMPEGTLINPSFRMNAEDAQALIDDLWACGLRPTNGVGSVGQLAATQAHLEDMRRLVFAGKGGE